MEIFLKKYHALVFPITMFIILLLLNMVLGIENLFLRIFIAAGLGYFLSPRKKKIQTQSGEKIQISWLFLKQSIFLD